MGVPALGAEEQVLAVLEAEQGQRFETDAIERFAKDDRIMGLQVAKFGREGEREHYVVAVFGAAAGDHPQLVVVDVVEQNGIGHGSPWF